MSKAKNKENMNGYIAIHPGEILRDELNERNFTQKQFAQVISIAPTMLNEIINSKRNITADISVLLEAALGIDAIIWLKFQMQYDITIAKKKESNIEKVSSIYKRATKSSSLKGSLE